jgi:hypothetical protein
MGEGEGRGEKGKTFTYTTHTRGSRVTCLGHPAFIQANQAEQLIVQAEQLID